MNSNLTEILTDIDERTKGDKIDLIKIVEALKHRGFGPLIMAPALITVLPTGAIPGMPLVCGILIILIATQLLVGKKYPWLPKRLQSVSFGRKQYKRALEKAKPYTRWIDGFFHPRLKFLTGEIAQRTIAFLCVGLALMVIAFGFVPFAAALPASAILFFGLALSIHDGLLTLIGNTMMAAAIITIPYIFQL